MYTNTTTSASIISVLSSNPSSSTEELPLIDILEHNSDVTLEQSKQIVRHDDGEKHNSHRGTLHMRIGPMFSGKTTWLNGELTQLADKGFSVIKIIHSDDVRSDVALCDDSGSTHNSSYRSLSDKIKCVRASNLANVDVSKFHVVGVDESQFFPDLIKMVEQWLEVYGKHMRVVGLDGDAFKKKFGQTLDLIPMCDEVVKLNASCRICLNELEKVGFHGNILGIMGPFTKRLGISREQKLVGGSSQYIPVCRFHHSVYE